MNNVSRRRFLGVVAGGVITLPWLASCGNDDSGDQTTSGGSGSETSGSGSGSSSGGSSTGGEPTSKSEGASGPVIDGKTVRWISPRGTLEVLDDFGYWTAMAMGYMGDLETKMQGGPTDATACVKFVDQDQADMGYPSPGVFSLAIEQGMDLTNVYQMGGADTFDIAVQKGSPIKTIPDLKGKTIGLGSAGWQSIVDPLLKAGGLDPKEVHYQTIGDSWAQALSQGQVDAALSWEGLRAQWLGQGLDFDYMYGQLIDDYPANCYVVRTSDVDNDHSREILTQYLTGWAKGLQFGYLNPRASTHITMEKFPALKKQMTPEIATGSLLQQLGVYHGNWEERGSIWGGINFDHWQKYLDVLTDLGQLKNKVKAQDIMTDELAKAAAEFDMDKVKADADGYKLPDDYAKLDVDKIKEDFLPKKS